MYFIGPLPAFGYYIRHIKNLEFFNCKITFENNDDRPAFLFDDGEKVNLTKVKMLKGAKAECFVNIRNTVNNFVIHDCPGLPEINESVSQKKF